MTCVIKTLAKPTRMLPILALFIWLFPISILASNPIVNTPYVLLPVFVFIHGGGFEIGDAETFGYKKASENFASEGIVFVTINYRLGPLGFFTTGDNVIPGNMGLWDQTLALQFLNEILSSFGGDPNRITLSGHSAGSSSVSALLFSPHSNDLFQQAIEMSGSVFAEYAMGQDVIKAFQTGIDNLIGKIRIRKNHWGNFSREDLLDFIKTGVVIEDEFGSKMGQFLHLLEEFYADRDIPDKPDNKFYLQRYIESSIERDFQLISDLLFNIPVYHEIDLKRMNGWETYYYVIEHPSNPFVDKDVPVKGLCQNIYYNNGKELFIVFNYYSLNLSDHEKKHYRNPSTSEVMWNPVTKDDPRTNLRLKAHPEMNSSFRTNAMEFWLKIVPNTIGAQILHRSRLPGAQAHIKHTEL
uniref:Carboxylic ester hydrolase n=1 Tax=Heterorhabditis bacteriophora TaxID=37862 RepID=A0A1I7X4H8_HETBA